MESNVDPEILSLILMNDTISNYISSDCSIDFLIDGVKSYKFMNKFDQINIAFEIILTVALEILKTTLNNNKNNKLNCLLTNNSIWLSSYINSKLKKVGFGMELNQIMINNNNNNNNDDNNDNNDNEDVLYYCRTFIDDDTIMNDEFLYSYQNFINRHIIKNSNIEKNYITFTEKYMSSIEYLSDMYCILHIKNEIYKISFYSKINLK